VIFNKLRSHAIDGRRRLLFDIDNVIGHKTMTMSDEFEGCFAFPNTAFSEYQNSDPINIYEDSMYGCRGCQVFGEEFCNFINKGGCGQFGNHEGDLVFCALANKIVRRLVVVRDNDTGNIGTAESFEIFFAIGRSLFADIPDFRIAKNLYTPSMDVGSVTRQGQPRFLNIGDVYFFIETIFSSNALEMGRKVFAF